MYDEEIVNIVKNLINKIKNNSKKEVSENIKQNIINFIEKNSDISAYNDEIIWTKDFPNQIKEKLNNGNFDE